MDYLISVFDRVGLWLIWGNVALIIIMILSFGKQKPRLLKYFGKAAFIAFGCELIIFGIGFLPLHVIFTSEGILWVQTITIIVGGVFFYWLYLSIDDSLD